MSDGYRKSALMGMPDYKSELPEAKLKNKYSYKKIYVDYEDYVFLKKLAKKEGKSMSDLVTKIILGT